MNAKMPPIPPENRSGKFADERTGKSDAPTRDRETKPDQRGQQANIKQNTTNQGYQQDR